MVIGSAFGIVSLAYCILMIIVYLYKRKAYKSSGLTNLFYGLLLIWTVIVGIIEIVCIWAIDAMHNIKYI